jgi:hypothetical protein
MVETEAFMWARNCRPANLAFVALRTKHLGRQDKHHGTGKARNGADKNNQSNPRE